MDVLPFAMIDSSRLTVRADKRNDLRPYHVDNRIVDDVASGFEKPTVNIGHPVLASVPSHCRAHAIGIAHDQSRPAL